jgi:hypothetical protein
MEKIQAIRRLFLNDKDELTPDAQVFFDDIARFGHFRATTHFFDDVGRLDPGVAGQLEGRRQLYLRIHEYVFATLEDLAEISQTMKGG